MKVQIKYVKFIFMFGRHLATGQLHDMNDKMLMDGSLAQILNFINENDADLVNAQDILNILVTKGGFAA